MRRRRRRPPAPPIQRTQPPPPPSATAELFGAAGYQTLGCGHLVEPGQPVIQLTPEHGRVLIVCEHCFARIGRTPTRTSHEMRE